LKNYIVIMTKINKIIINIAKFPELWYIVPNRKAAQEKGLCPAVGGNRLKRTPCNVKASTNKLHRCIYYVELSPFAT